MTVAIRSTGSLDWFTRSHLKFVRDAYVLAEDAYVLAEFVGLLPVERARFGELGREQWPDGYVKLLGKTHNMEVTSRHGVGGWVRNIAAAISTLEAFLCFLTCPDHITNLSEWTGTALAGRCLSQISLNQQSQANGAAARRKKCDCSHAHLPQRS